MGRISTCEENWTSRLRETQDVCIAQQTRSPPFPQQTDRRTTIGLFLCPLPDSKKERRLLTGSWSIKRIKRRKENIRHHLVHHCTHLQRHLPAPSPYIDRQVADDYTLLPPARPLKEKEADDRCYVFWKQKTALSRQALQDCKLLEYTINRKFVQIKIQFMSFFFAMHMSKVMSFFFRSSSFDTDVFLCCLKYYNYFNSK